MRHFNPNDEMKPLIPQRSGKLYSELTLVFEM